MKDEPKEQGLLPEFVTCMTCLRVMQIGDDIWFTKEESPTNEVICDECFDTLPCEGCAGL